MANIPSLEDKYMFSGINPQHALSTYDEDGNLNMLVEIPKGTYNKYEYVLEANLIKLDRVPFAPFPYPIEYGAIPQTWDEDQDLLDVMCLVTHPTFPGCLISARVIGIMHMVDGGEVDDKVVAVPDGDVRFKHIKSINDLQPIQKDEIQTFWENYKKLQFQYKGQTDKKVEIMGWGDVEEAKSVIEKCMEEYKSKFSK